MVYLQTFAAVSEGPRELAIAVSGKGTIEIALDPSGVCLYSVLSSFLSLDGLIKLQENIGRRCYGTILALLGPAAMAAL